MTPAVLHGSPITVEPEIEGVVDDTPPTVSDLVVDAELASQSGDEAVPVSRRHEQR
jgi:hypothetical protein